MRLIIDTNIILSALLKDGTTRQILMSKEIEFYTPCYALSETIKYIDLVKRKSGLSEYEIKIILKMLFENIKIVPTKKVIVQFNPAFEIMKNIDPKDTPILACALAIPNDGIWTNDKHLKKQKLNKTISTKELTIQQN